MEPNRFDDVDTRIVEEPPEPRAARRSWRVGPALLAATAALSLMGSLAAGASALTSTAQAPTRVIDNSGYVHYLEHRAATGHHGLCDKAARQRAADLSY